jgi:hypothetical protein
MNKELCECGEIAVWTNLGSSKYQVYCDDCVPRGCTCNHYYTPNDNHQYDINDSQENPPTDHNNWKWIEEGKVWTLLDEQGREYTCCEFIYEEEGWEVEDEK